MRENKDKRLLERIFSEIEDIEQFTENVTENYFMYNREKQKAVCFSLQNIGEYAKNISDNLKNKHQDIEWSGIYGLRNIIAHDYAKISMEQVWRMVQDDLAKLRQDIKKMIDGFSSYAEADLLVKAKVKREDIQMLVKLVEGLGHLGVVTTVNKVEGEIIIQSTKDCWPDLRTAILSMPFIVQLMD